MHPCRRIQHHTVSSLGSTNVGTLMPPYCCVYQLQERRVQGLRSKGIAVAGSAMSRCQAVDETYEVYSCCVKIWVPALGVPHDT